MDIDSTVDRLDRRPFAQILAKRIKEIHARRDQPDTPDSERRGAYIAHLHGQWGTGKSTVLNFLREELRPKDEASGWVVVDFNAWRTQSSRPPWWTLVREIHQQAGKQAPFKYQRGIWWHWVVWHWAMAMGPWMIAAAVMLAVAYFLKGLGTATELIAGVIAGAITLVTLGRSLLFGSSKAAESFMDQRKDATRPVKDRYAKLIRAIGQPVIVFVDDVDRCDKAYVVELLEGIQTLFREAPVTFLIAADRKWICRSFEKHFEDFGTSVGDAARPLGYLFLEKLFQLSVSLPPLSLRLQQEFQAALLRQGGDPAEAEQVLMKAEEIAEGTVKTGLTQAQADELVDATTDLIQKQAVQRVLAKRLASVTMDAQRKHDLEPFANLIESNPRAIKRFLNAYGMQQSLSRLENRRIPTEHLVRWTILELRWPLLAEHVCTSPKVIDQVKLASAISKEKLAAETARARRLREATEEERRIILTDTPQYLQELLDDPHLVKVVGVSSNGGRVLTSEVVLNIVGALVEPDQRSAGIGSNVAHAAQPKSA
ncbi:MAG: P-loop NTPase fold protein [Flavobacteriales bacterium]